MSRFEISKGADRALGLLHGNGYEAYVVGGAIRNMIMGTKAHDFDITTNATPDEVISVLGKENIIETGIKHGTVTFLYRKENVEITTYRIDGKYKDSRHPDAVEFSSSLEEDLKRRDFTINAIAYDGKDKVVDLFEGQSDIKKKKIKAIGNPYERFSEDALRILRGIRFSSTLGFEIEDSTRQAMAEKKHLLKNISKERIASEINTLLCGKYIRKTILSCWDILDVIFPQLDKMNGFDQKNPHHVYDLLTHTAIVTENVRPVPYMRLSAFFHDFGKIYTFRTDGNGTGHFYGHAGESVKCADAYLNEYKYDNSTGEKVNRIVKYHDEFIKPDNVLIRKRLSKLGKETFFDLLELKRADNLAQSPEFNRQDYFDILYKKALEISEEHCFTVKDLQINGDDLIGIGIEKGKRIGEILSCLLNEVMEEKIQNVREELLTFVKNNYCRKK